jgi:hypothetical protein
MTRLGKYPTVNPVILAAAFSVYSHGTAADLRQQALQLGR